MADCEIVSRLPSTEVLVDLMSVVFYFCGLVGNDFTMFAFSLYGWRRVGWV